MQQQKERMENLKVEPSGGNAGASKDNVPKNTFTATSRKGGFHSGIKFVGNTKKSTQIQPFSFDARPKSEKVNSTKEAVVNPLTSDSRPKFEKAAPRKCGFHSGIKFIGNPKKSTQIKPFSFDARPKSEKVTTTKETEVKHVTSDSRPNSEKVSNAKKTEAKPLPFNPDIAQVTIFKPQLKPLYFDLCPDADEAICMHEDGKSCESLFAAVFADCLSETSQSTPKSKKVENTEVAAAKPFRFEAQQKSEKASPRKCHFHSGIKFIWNPKKSTQIKPFSFDARPKSEKVTATKETEVKPVTFDSRPNSEKVSNAKKTEVKPFCFDPDTEKVVIFKPQLKPLYFDLCPEADEAICMHEDGKSCESIFAKAFADCLSETSQSTPKSEKVENTEVTATEPFRFEGQQKSEKVLNRNVTEIKMLSSRIPQKEGTIKTANEADVKRLGSEVRSKPEKEKDPNEAPLEANPSSSDVQPQAEKGIRRNYRAHSGLKFIPRKKGTVVKPFSFENRTSTLKPKPGSTALDV